MNFLAPGWVGALLILIFSPTTSSLIEISNTHIFTHTHTHTKLWSYASQQLILKDSTVRVSDDNYGNYLLPTVLSLDFLLCHLYVGHDSVATLAVLFGRVMYSYEYIFQFQLVYNTDTSTAGRSIQTPSYQ